ncbi:MAG TPA: sulfotransferase, partial [Caulobacteraceae bacterium]|nr:sulfotransferase [Caulobacteraceae bacterium]
EIGDYHAAAETTAALLAEFPDQPQAWLLQGAALRTLGRAEEAIGAFRRVLELDPARAEAWWSLANLKSYRFSPADRLAMEASLADAQSRPEDRSLLHFALAKTDKDLGRDAEAFSHYLEGNALQRSQRRYDADATSSFVRRAEALFTPAFFAERAGWGDPRPDPIFIVGLPRSGSTLVEQILASHPQVEGTRELMDIQAMADWASRQTPAIPYPGALAALSREAFAQLGHDYLARSLPLRRLGRLRFIDKAPWNWMHVGLIRLMLPNARIVDVRRQPLAACVSAFRQHFAGGFDFTYDLADLGRYYADYAGLMAHFDTVLPGCVVRIGYEALVEDTEGEVRRLLAALGLPFDPACLRFFENPRAVATPSSEQVRRPIFTDGVHGWRRYEPWLGQLEAALGPALDDDASP